MRSNIPHQSFTFNSRIADEQLREWMAPAEVLRIVRGSWRSSVEFRSDEDVHEVEKRLVTAFESWQEEKMERDRLEGEAKYDAWVEKIWSNKPGVPALTTRRGKPSLEGYYFIDDNCKMQHVFPED